MKGSLLLGEKKERKEIKKASRSYKKPKEEAKTPEPED